MKTLAVFIAVLVATLAEPEAKPAPEPLRIVKEGLIETPALYKSLPLEIQEVPVLSKDQVLVGNPLIEPTLDVQLTRKVPAVLETQEIVETPQASFSRKDFVEIPGDSSHVFKHEVVETPALYKTIPVVNEGQFLKHEILRKPIFEDVQLIQKQEPLEDHNIVSIERKDVIGVPDIIQTPALYKTLPLDVKNLEFINEPLLKSRIGIDKQPIIVETKQLVKATPDLGLPFAYENVLDVPSKTSQIFKHEIVQTPTLLRKVPIEIDQVPIVNKEIPFAHILQQKVVEKAELPLLRYKPEPITTQQVVETENIPVFRKELPLEYIQNTLPVARQEVLSHSVVKTPQVPVEILTNRFVDVPRDVYYKSLPLEYRAVPAIPEEIPIAKSELLENKEHVLFNNVQIVPEIPTLRKEVPVQVQLLQTPLVKSDVSFVKKELPLIPNQKLVDTTQLHLLKHNLVPDLSLPLIPKDKTFTHKIAETPYIGLYKTDLDHAHLQQGYLPHHTLYKTIPYNIQLTRDPTFLRHELSVLPNANLNQKVVGTWEVPYKNIQLQLLKQGLPLLSDVHTDFSFGGQLPLLRSETHSQKVEGLGIHF